MEKTEQRLMHLNELLVTMFFQMSQLEKESLSKIPEKITIREIHVLEVVDYLSKTGKNKMMEIARLLGISTGSLTTAVNVLHGKGYLCRETNDVDRRMIFIFLTEKGRQANQVHLKFHTEIRKTMEQNFSFQQTECLLSVLKQLEAFLMLEEEKLKKKN